MPFVDTGNTGTCLFHSEYTFLRVQLKLSFGNWRRFLGDLKYDLVALFFSQ
jgi:hypothetical protein